MEVKRFAVSTCWGKGHHHFNATDMETRVGAEAFAKTVFSRASRKKGSLRPTVYVWEHISEIKDG